jgi:GNAT superfamily N-acetyltransferase
MAQGLVCRRASMPEILDLRHKVLRPGKPLESAEFPGDEQPGTLHFAAWDHGRMVVCLTLMRSVWDGAKAWQLRGMATDTAAQGRGHGTALMRFAMEDAAREGWSDVFWCNARLAAVPFYERNGWRIASERFDIPLVGPHHKMVTP